MGAAIEEQQIATESLSTVLCHCVTNSNQPLTRSGPFSQIQSHMLQGSHVFLGFQLGQSQKYFLALPCRIMLHAVVPGLYAPKCSSARKTYNVVEAHATEWYELELES